MLSIVCSFSEAKNTVLDNYGCSIRKHKIVYVYQQWIRSWVAISHADPFNGTYFNFTPRAYNCVLNRIIAQPLYTGAEPCLRFSCRSFFLDYILINVYFSTNSFFIIILFTDSYSGFLFYIFLYCIFLQPLYSNCQCSCVSWGLNTLCVGRVGMP